MTYNELSAIIDRMTDEEKEKDVSISFAVPSDENQYDPLITAISEVDTFIRTNFCSTW